MMLSETFHIFTLFWFNLNWTWKQVYEISFRTSWVNQGPEVSVYRSLGKLERNDIDFI